jgi:hypothetical protein
MCAAVSAQQKTIFAVTGEQPGSVQWTSIRQMSGDAGAKMIFDASKPASFVAAKSRKSVTPTAHGLGADLTPGSGGVAALAYDAKHNRLYFSPLFRDGGIRSIDLNPKAKQQTVTVYDDAYNLLDRARDGEGKNITRMVIGTDDFGYAISNDGNSFLRFSTRNASLENLGALVDDEANGATSVHNACNSWGGDLVAAANGDLYLFTMRQQVYRIDPQTRVATHLGALKGPDAQFAVNGAAVDEEGRVVLCSSVQPGIRWIVEDMNTLAAKAEKADHWLNASDLASANLLFAKKKVAEFADLNLSSETDNNQAVGIYPNPVVNGSFQVVFKDLEPGKYALDMINTLGVTQASKTVEVREKGQTETMRTNRLAKGLYILRITNAGKQQAFAQKVVVQ